MWKIMAISWTLLIMPLLLSPCQAAHVAICFTGLTRSLQFTIQNIRSSILDPIIDEGHTYTIFLHTFNKSTSWNPRAAEINVPLKWQAYRLLQPAAFQVDNVDAVDRLLFDNDLQDWLKFDGSSAWNLRNADGTVITDAAANVTVMNFVKATWSSSECTSLWEPMSGSFDAVMYLRSDAWFFNNFNASMLNTLADNTIYVPDWHHFGGLNDRFALGVPQVMLTGTVIASTC